MPFITGSGVSNAQTKCLSVVIPDEERFRQAVIGALSMLTNISSWEQSGTDTRDECVSAAWDMWLSLHIGGSCGAMIGSILPFATSVLPDGVLLCDGTQYNRVDYPELYAVLDSAFVVDVDHFRTPDLRGRDIIGEGQGTGLTNRSIGAFGGSERHQLTTSEMPSHAHSESGASLAGLTYPLGGTPYAFPNPSISGLAGGDQSHNNMQPFLVLTYGIVAR